MSPQTTRRPLPASMLDAKTMPTFRMESLFTRKPWVALFLRLGVLTSATISASSASGSAVYRPTAHAALPTAAVVVSAMARPPDKIPRAPVLMPVSTAMAAPVTAEAPAQAAVPTTLVAVSTTPPAVSLTSLKLLLAMRGTKTPTPSGCMRRLLSGGIWLSVGPWPEPMSGCRLLPTAALAEAPAAPTAALAAPTAAVAVPRRAPVTVSSGVSLFMQWIT
mmetsp:Transcript_90835/g.211329  ORF Transcript_90835/g.211329 Transcript_90835/m.211329 type:complete len:220 (-) Transcript_90835:802-1461(-)